MAINEFMERYKDIAGMLLLIALQLGRSSNDAVDKICLAGYMVVGTMGKYSLPCSFLELHRYGVHTNRMCWPLQ
jgi:hypothetical protein